MLEPSRRDSGPAVAVAAGLAARRSPETIVVVLAADHVVRDQPGLVDLCKKAASAAREGYIVTLGVKPDCAGDRLWLSASRRAIASRQRRSEA